MKCPARKETNLEPPHEYNFEAIIRPTPVTARSYCHVQMTPFTTSYNTQPILAGTRLAVPRKKSRNSRQDLVYPEIFWRPLRPQDYLWSTPHPEYDGSMSSEPTAAKVTAAGAETIILPVLHLYIQVVRARVRRTMSVCRRPHLLPCEPHLARVVPPARDC